MLCVSRTCTSVSAVSITIVRSSPGGVRRCGGGQLVPSSRTAQTATMGDMDSAACMLDHFDKIQKLPDPIPGVPNFRRVPGFKVRVLQCHNLRIHFY